MPNAGFLARAGELLGFSKFWRKNGPLPGLPLDSGIVDAVRMALGGQLQRPPITQTEWLLEDVDIATRMADIGDMQRAAGLARAMKRDLLIHGLLRTKSGGVTRLKKEWFGSERVREDLTETDHGIPRFDLLAPPQQLRKMAEDFDLLGVAVGELVPVEGRDYPILERKEPENLYYLWPWNLWVFRSTAGILPIIPGDGRWVFETAGGLSPWQDGLCWSVGRSWVRKDSAQHLFDNWMFTLANPARVGYAPQGATPTQRQNFFESLAMWGINSVFELIPGWEAKILETNGRGWEGFESAIKLASEEIIIGLAGQLQSITGGSGFSSEDMPMNIRTDLLEETAVPLAHTVNTQILPIYTYNRFPEEFDECPGYLYKVEQPQDLSKEASVYTAIGAGIQQLQDAAARSGYDIDVAAVFGRYGLTLIKRPEQGRSVQLGMAPTDVAKVVTVDEARMSQGLGPIGDERGKMTIQELTDSLKAPESLPQLPAANARYKGGPFRSARANAYTQNDVEIPKERFAAYEIQAQHAEQTKKPKAKAPRRSRAKIEARAVQTTLKHQHDFKATHAGQILAITDSGLNAQYAPADALNVEPVGDIALISIQGPLEHHGCACEWCQQPPFHTYDLILDTARQAFDGEAKVVLVRCTSPGGEVAGCFEASRELRRMADATGKPLVWFVDGETSSAAWALAMAADLVLVPQEASGASIGVYFEAKSEKRAYEAAGIDVELIRSGEHKADGHPFLELTDEAREELQRRVDEQSEIFFALVAERRKLDIEKVREFRGRVYLGADLVRLGLADKVCDYSQALEVATILAASSGEESETP